ncbi:hypothetical protein NM688_g1956 [Phlebia brevispora]|uniref:Uncharacterized protein n=1 Tax=Phlebia brevispora TaxID=194682 RepID=A0ACC1T9V4_9APHY|nr:hypothetical protein NM688_g1956 [Phlebia brevispora]
MFSATLARRLPEFSDLMLKYFTSENFESNEHLRTFDSVCRRAIKHELGNISLVCSYWASQARPKIFEKIELRQYKDIETLKTFLDFQHSRISRYIKHIDLSLSLPRQDYEPWVRALSTFIIPKLGHVSLTIAGPFFSAGSMIHGYNFVSRVYDTSSLRYLTLSDTHITAPRAFFRLPKELPCLEELTSQQVTWDLSSEVVRCPPSARNTSPPIAGMVFGHADSRITLVLSTLIALILHDRMNSGLPMHDSRSGGEYGDSSAKTIRWQSFTSERPDNKRVLMPDIAICFAQSARGQGRYRVVRAVHIRVRGEEQEAIIHHWDWAAIDHLAEHYRNEDALPLELEENEVCSRNGAGWLDGGGVL